MNLNLCCVDQWHRNTKCSVTYTWQPVIVARDLCGWGQWQGCAPGAAPQASCALEKDKTIKLWVDDEAACAAPVPAWLVAASN